MQTSYQLSHHPCPDLMATFCFQVHRRARCRAAAPTSTPGSAAASSPSTRPSTRSTFPSVVRKTRLTHNQRLLYFCARICICLRDQRTHSPEKFSIKSLEKKHKNAPIGFLPFVEKVFTVKKSFVESVSGPALVAAEQKKTLP